MISTIWRPRKACQRNRGPPAKPWGGRHPGSVPHHRVRCGQGARCGGEGREQPRARPDAVPNLRTSRAGRTVRSEGCGGQLFPRHNNTDSFRPRGSGFPRSVLDMLTRRWHRQPRGPLSRTAAAAPRAGPRGRRCRASDTRWSGAPQLSATSRTAPPRSRGWSHPSERARRRATRGS
jgi:hypothetical protein